MPQTIVVLSFLTLGSLLCYACQVYLLNNQDANKFERNQWTNHGFKFAIKKHCNGTFIAIDHLLEKFVFVDSKNLEIDSTVFDFDDILRVDLLINGENSENKSNNTGGKISSVELKVVVKNHLKTEYNIPFNEADSVSKNIRNAGNWKNLLSKGLENKLLSGRNIIG